MPFAKLFLSLILIVLSCAGWSNGSTWYGSGTSSSVNLSAVDQGIYPSADNTYDIGSSAKSWHNIYADGTIYGSNILLNGSIVNVGAYSIYPSNSEAVNNTNWAALMAGISAGTSIYFPVGTYNFSTPLSVSKSCNIFGDGEASIVHSTANNITIFDVTSSSVDIHDLTISGTGSDPDSYILNYGIYFHGADSSNYLTNVFAHNILFENLNAYGIRGKYISNFDFQHNTINSVGYSGIGILSALHCNISNNIINTVTGLTSNGNAYGIFLSRNTGTSLITDPVSENCNISLNDVSNVQTWEGIDTHSGKNILISNNRVTDSLVGIEVTSDSDNYASKNISVIGNILDSRNLTNTYQGIQFVGANKSIGSSYNKATGIISDNFIYGFNGTIGVSTGGGMYIRDTDGLIISNNYMQDVRDQGILLYHDNSNFNVQQNVIVDPHGTTGFANNTAYGINVSNEYNTGYISQNISFSTTTISDDTTIATGAGTSGTVKLYQNSVNNNITGGESYCSIPSLSWIANNAQDKNVTYPNAFFNSDIEVDGKIYLPGTTNIGIGTTTPASRLQVGNGPQPNYNAAPTYGTGKVGIVSEGTSGEAGIGAYIYDGVNNNRVKLFVDNTNNIWGLYNAYSGGTVFPFTIVTANQERLRITSGGNVGIGTTTSASRLKVVGVGTGTAKTLEIDNSLYSPNVVILDNGNVGINSTAPVAKLDVQGNVQVDGTIYPEVDNVYDIGSTSNSWHDMHVDGVIYAATISMSSTLEEIGSNTFPANVIDLNAEPAGILIDPNVYTSGSYFGDGSHLTGVSVATGWTDDGTSIRLTTSTDNVGIGTTIAPARLAITSATTLNNEAAVKIYNSDSTIGLELRPGGSGKFNTLVGQYAGVALTTGVDNTMIGKQAGYNLITGAYNTVVGSGAYFNGTGSFNAAYGVNTMNANTSGGANSAYGHNALLSNTTGSNNVAIGYKAGRYFADGTTALTDPENSIYIGYGAYGKDNSDNNTIVIGYNAIGRGANSTEIGSSSTTLTHINGNVGIGTITAGSRLTVSGVGTTTGRAFEIDDSVYANKFIVLDNGNVGIGTTAPTGAFIVSSADTIGWTIKNASNTACSTTCTSACVMGLDTAAVGPFLDCSNTTADTCLCAGQN